VTASRGASGTRCQNCGHLNQPGRVRCIRCGESLLRAPGVGGAGASPSPTSVTHHPMASPLWPASPAPPPQPPGRSVAPASTTTPALVARFYERVVRGHVVSASTPQLVRAPFDWLGLLARVALGIIAVMMLMSMLQSLETIAVIIILLVWWALYKLTPWLVRAGYRVIGRTTSGFGRWIFRRRDSHITSIVISVRDHHGRVYDVRIDGQITSGHIGIGDDVSIATRYRAGVLTFTRGINHRRDAPIRVTRRPWQLG
jgi:hypothetical protein